MRIRLAPQVADFLAALAPQPRRQVRDALRGLAQGRGDVKPLQRELSG